MRTNSASAALFPVFLAHFAASRLIAIVAVIAADDTNLTFGFFARSEVERADTYEGTALWNPLYDTAMPVRPMHDVVVSECGRRQHGEGAHRGYAGFDHFFSFREANVFLTTRFREGFSSRAENAFSSPSKCPLMFR
jgi:hypothetical protein